MSLKKPKWAQKTLNIFKMALYELKIELKWAQVSNPKWAEKSLNELKWALMNSNFNKLFITEAYSVQNMTYMTIFKAM